MHNGREILDRAQDSQTEENTVRADLLASMNRGPRTSFVVDYLGIDFDGNALGPKTSKLSIDPFDDERKISDLPLYPIKYAEASNGLSARGSASLEESTSLWAALLQRGRRFVELANAKHMKHCEYRGMTLDDDPELVRGNHSGHFMRMVDPCAGRQPCHRGYELLL